ncbi:glycosyltransferase [Pseudomonas typographi]|uniref:Glycosyltransferase n=1 Tax=Pseudomonas typographi TaxID=2715964 RepID=A0ABR7ZAF4_9PSED|nr:glycosyltransferase [Pseudomonas typographi]MBD1555168.1 glycosyltransferase [Pseudomonas typographi]MBD1589971.1 glycosyltransferase [Pseudomonas typographi]MBD1602358.1 glycosyltransferase [Pseudomonas typographi]
MSAALYPSLPRVAVLLAAHNGERWLPEQLQSIRNQQGVQVQIYISVDMSDDGTLVCCQGYAEQYRDITLLQPGKFGSAGRNFFRLIRDVPIDGFDYVAFADQDDVWLANKLRRAVELLCTRQIAAYSSNVIAFWPDGRRQVLNKAQPQVHWDHLFEAAGPGCTYVLTPALAHALRSFVSEKWAALQEVTLHDWLIYAYARQAGWQWFIDPEPGVLYRQHAANQVGANTSIRSALNRWRRIRQGWWFDQISRIATIIDVKEPSPVIAEPIDRRQIRRMLINSRQCRRRLRDKWLFSGLCLVALVVGVRV